MDIALDPIGYSNALQEAGMPREQADIIARTQQANIEKVVSGMRFVDSDILRELATKAELKELDELARGETTGLRGEFADLRKDMAMMRNDMNAMQTSIIELRKDMDARFDRVNASMDARFEKQEISMDAKLAQTKNDILRWMFGMLMGFAAVIISAIALMR